MAAGELAFVLHAHLPFIRHPEHRYHLEENWLYEATTATYLPLLEVFRGLQRDSVPYRFSISMSPPLVTMLRDDLLKTRTAAYLDRLLRLGDEELRRTHGDPTFHKLARFYADRFARLKALYDAIHGDVVGAFAALQDAGLVEIITVGATHGYLPVIREATARRAQIQVACESYQRHFGRWPRGIWLPECGYAEGVDAILADAGLRYFFLDSHGVMNARPRPPLGIHAPVYCKTGVAAFGRDLESSKQVWSAREGYPGDATYRDFYRDIGFDLPLDQIGPYIHPDGIRLHTGYKYFRVTGADVDLSRKQPYDPDAAREKAATHAGNFVFNRGQQATHLAAHMDRRPLIVSPYDAELYGHWWFEGPMFLDFLARKIAFDQETVRLTTCAEYLEQNPVNAVVEPSPSSWGDGGYSAVWVDGSNDWIYRHVHRAEGRMQDLARRFKDGAGELERRALNQAARELLLAQSSDWAFIMKTATAVKYACDRVKAHLARFRRLDREISDGRIDAGWLADLESRDNIFPELDYRTYV
ncbi:MAG TPA: 1,4-alpha-glucan branching protein domain-containing protein [Polyangia bacterium]|nr:1,4-alpha-glucan branching protein domain-containing protein [Polyangia bacterium]